MQVRAVAHPVVPAEDLLEVAHLRGHADRAGAPVACDRLLQHQALGAAEVEAPLALEEARRVRDHADARPEFVVPVVALVERDVVIGAAEGEGGAETAQTGANDGDVELGWGPGGHGWWRWRELLRWFRWRAGMVEA